MSITPAKGQYRQLADELRRRIESGEFPRGRALPSEETLAAEAGLSRPIVNKALAILRREGVVRVERGKGTFVNELPVITRDSSIRQKRSSREEAGSRGPFAGELNRLGLTPRSDVVQVGEVEAPEEVAELLGVEPSSPVAIRRRQMFADDIPVQLATSYIPWSIAEGTVITEEDTGPGGLYSRLADLGHAPITFEETVFVRPPSEDEARFLRLETDHRVYAITRVALSEDDRPVEVVQMVLPAHQWKLKYRWSAS